MQLFLNDEPFSLTPQQVAEYSKETVYRVGLQYISPVRMEDLKESSKQFWIAPVHIDCQYFLKEKNPLGGYISKGKLRYAESANERSENGIKWMDYQPQYMGIGEIGYRVVSAFQPELNFFLQNHPRNEVVKNTEDHPNRDPKMETIFSTYQESKVVDRKMEELDIAFEIQSKLREKDNAGVFVLNHDYIKALSATILNASYNNTVNFTALSRFDVMNDKALRQRLLELGARYPREVKAAMDASGVNYREVINKWKEAGILHIVGDQWIHQKNKTEKSVIIKVPQNQDADEWINLFFRERDQNGYMFKEVSATYKRWVARQKGNELGKEHSLQTEK